MPRRRPPSAKFLVKQVTAIALENGRISGELWLLAIESNGQLGPELHLGALDKPTLRYFFDRVGTPVDLGVKRRRRTKT